MSDLKKKGILLITSIVLLLTILIYATVAWFTKMTSVSGMDFDIAQWDFTANYAVSDIVVNVYDYYSLTPNKVAPGTSGEIPIRISAENADTDIDYVIRLDTTVMSDDFQKRLFFYKDKEMTDENEMLFDNPILGTLEKGQTALITVYWKWIYDYSYFDPETLKPASEQRTAPTLEDTTGMTEEEKSAVTSQWRLDLAAWNQESSDWDTFDTMVGKNPEIYKTQMNVTLSISGAERLPQQIVPVTPDPEP